jgi:putative tryptophan/tyrosine transport system substrate-binding protein
MRRREFIAGLGSAAAWPVVVRAQQPERMRRIGVLMNLAEDDQESRIRVSALEKDLETLGWKVGRTLVINYRWSIDNLEKARAAVIELLPLAPDVILANGTPSVQGLLSVTRTVPAVATLITEPVAMGFVESLARPGGNLTGFTHLPPTVGGKLFDLLREIAPNVARVAYIFNPQSSPYAGLFYGSMQQAASKVGAQTTYVPVYGPAELEPVFADVARIPGGGFVTNVDVFTLTHRKLIVELAARYKLPAIYQRRLFSTDGGLASYSVDDSDHFRQVAAYVDRILRGQKPADLPVQQPTKFEIVINLKTAKALGLTIPETLLATADEVIQ